MTSRQLLVATKKLLEKKKPKIGQLIDIVESERVLEKMKEKGIFIVLTTELLLKILSDMNIRMVKFRNDVYTRNIVKEKKANARGKSKGKDGYTRKRTRNLKKIKENALEEIL